MSSRRKERVSEALRQAVSKVIITELKDPRMGFVTVTKVEPSPDLTSAKVFVSVLGEPSVCRRTMQGLTSARGFIRRAVGQLVTMRSVPALRFVADDSVKRSIRISRLIADALGEHQAGPEDAGPEDAGDEDTGPEDAGDESEG